MPRRPFGALLAAALAIAGCQGQRGPPPERFVPAAVTAAVILPESGRAAEELAALHATASRFPGAGELAASRGALAAQLGFDPLDREALADAGVDPRRGAALAVLAPPGGGSGALIVLPARDVGKVERLLARLARDRLGATERSAEAQAGIAAVIFRRPGTAAAALTYAMVERTAIVSTGEHGPALVKSAAALAPQASLAQLAAWKVARGALGEDFSAFAFVPPGSALLRSASPLADGAALGVSAAPGRLRARAAIILGAREGSFRALVASGNDAPPGAPLDPAAPLVARFDGDFAALGRKLVPSLGSGTRAFLERRGLDLERDLFAVLAPGGAISLGLPPGLSLRDLTTEAARNDPLRVLEFEAILPVRPGSHPAAGLERLGRAFGKVRRGHGADASIARVATPSGEIAWTHDPTAGRILAAGGAPGRLEALLARVASQGPAWKAPTPEAEAALYGGLGGAALDVGKLVAAVRALPDDAFGGGPSGFVMRSLVERVVHPAARLAAMSVRADLVEGALVLTVHVQARAGGEAR